MPGRRVQGIVTVVESESERLACVGRETERVSSR
jgi:hypothetical protein